MTLSRRTLCMDHNGLIHVASRITRGRTDAFTLCGRDMRIQSYWTAGARDAPTNVVTCSRCNAEAKPNTPRQWGDLFDAVERERKDN